MATKQQWEYLVEHGLEPARLAEVGNQGWELVSIVPEHGREGLVFYFKRPAANLRERVTLDHRQRFVAAQQREGSGE
jgi:hypothetical protein